VRLVAELVRIDGETYKQRSPLGVLGLSLITFGIYYFYWYYQVNDELRRFTRDASISPARSLMAVLFGWIIIVPPFIAMYNTAKHIQQIERRDAIQPVIEPVLVIVFMLLLSIVNPPYVQAHLNPIWGRSGDPGTSAAALPPPPG
jgi:H+/Cl- antiporter ClcA